MSFQIKYQPGCKFDNSLEKIKNNVEKKFPQLVGSIEYINECEKGYLQAFHDGLLFFSKKLSMSDNDVNDLYAAIEEMLADDEE